MPTNRTYRTRRWQPELDPYKREQLLFGPEAVLLAGCGYYRTAANYLRTAPAEEHAEALAAMERDWREHRTELLRWWNDPDERARAKFTTHEKPGGPGTRPWAAEQFD